MMSALEHEILEKFHQLDVAAQQRVEAAIAQETARATSFNYDAWIREVETIRQEIRTEHDGQHPAINVVELLRDIRDGEDE